MKKETEILTQQEQPHDEETENTVLSTLMRYNDKFDLYSDLLTEDLFYYKKQKAMFRCIEGIIRSGKMTDINSLANYAKTHDVGIELFRNDFLEIFPKTNVQVLEQDIQRLRDMSKRRQLWMTLQMACRNIFDMTNDLGIEGDMVVSEINDIISDVGKSSYRSFGDALQKVKEIVEKNKIGEKQYLVTGFKLFDNNYLLRPQTLTVIAAGTGVGKSALALNICIAVAKQNIPCAYFSLEMSDEELATRGISKEVGVPAKVIMNKILNEGQERMFGTISDSYSKIPLYFDENYSTNFDRTTRNIRTMVKKLGIKLAVIDYLQIYSQIGDSDEESIAYMARAAKNVAKETNIPVIILSQLNRKEDHPTIKSLRGSGQIEESADNIVLIDRPEAYPDNKVKSYVGEFKDKSIHNSAKLILAKGRGVGTDYSLVGFEAEYTRFFEPEMKVAEKSYEHDDNLPF